MRRTYLWELASWPDFAYDPRRLLTPLSNAAQAFGELSGLVDHATRRDRAEAEIRALVADAVDTSAIEGERLDAEAVRDSIVRRLSIGGAGVRRADDRTEGVIDVTMDVIKADEPVTEARLFAWHSWLFPIVRNHRPLRNIGAYRDDADGPMTVQSSRAAGKRPRIHYEAPPASRIEPEMRALLAYIEGGSDEEPMVRSAIVHLWFLLIHPFEDGNGRIARALADLMISRARGANNRYCSLSRQILLEQRAYYDELEYAGFNGFEITRWIAWFLGCYGRAAAASTSIVKDVLRATRFFTAYGDQIANDRQRKVLKVLLDGFEGKLNANKYAAITKTSHDTANRDLLDLASKQILVREGGSKNTSYRLASEQHT